MIIAVGNLLVHKPRRGDMNIAVGNLIVHKPQRGDMINSPL